MKRPSAGAILVLLLAPAAQAQNLTTQQSIDLAVKIKTKVNDLAYAQCLAGTDESRQSAISLNIAGLIKSLTGSLSLNDRKRVIRGAIDAPAAIRPAMDEHIRDCLQRRTPRIEQDLLNLAQQLQQPTTAAAGMPSVVDLHFTYRRQASLDPRRYSENVRLNLREGATVISRNLAPQSETDGSPWFEHVYHPYPSGRVEGTITATPLNSRLTADQTPRAQICLDRPTPLPRQNVDYDYFDCVEGGACKGSSRSTGWLRPCVKSASLWQELSPISRAWAQEASVRRWVTPSLDTLAARVPDGVGWSYFKLRTDFLRRPDIRAVEVGLAVNGTPVEEDGLSPRERPVPNDPAVSFNYLFALQTLNFHGAEAGCDRVSVTLTPRLADGARGSSHRFDLLYAALRDQPSRTEQAGDARLQWSASVIRPIREWRHWAIVQSYGFHDGDETSRQAAAAAADRDRRWLDGAGLIYQDAAIRGVVRPPRTIQNGRGAYGLAVGLLQPVGQIRFTFSEGEARRLGDWMIAHRAGSAMAARVIAPQAYPYQAPSGAVTPPGVCGRS